LYFKRIDIIGVCDFGDLRKLKEFKNLIKYIDINKVKIQYNGFNVNHILNAVTQIKTFKNKENIIVASGRLNDPLKGMDILFEALNKINLKNWKVYLIGSDGDYLKKLHNDFINSKPELKDQIINIGFLNDRDKYFSLLNQSKIYVLPSRIDGMPHVIPEAMALGNVVVGSSHHGVRVATEDGEIGRLHEIGNSEKLSEILSELMNNDILLEELSIASFNKAHNEFEWGKIVENVFKDYL
jgi:glycosyltransferase involved in cell wall biosynthesis